MKTAVLIQTLLIVTGMIFFILAFWAYASQKLIESIGLGWGLFSILLMITGAVTRSSDLSEAGSQKIYLLFLVLGIFLLTILFGVSVAVSGLRMKNQELAMQVSLLNQENERILQELGILTRESAKIQKQSKEEKQ